MNSILLLLSFFYRQQHRKMCYVHAWLILVKCFTHFHCSLSRPRTTVNQYYGFFSALLLLAAVMRPSKYSFYYSGSITAHLIFIDSSTFYTLSVNWSWRRSTSNQGNMLLYTHQQPRIWVLLQMLAVAVAVTLLLKFSLLLFLSLFGGGDARVSLCQSSFYLYAPMAFVLFAFVLVWEHLRLEKLCNYNYN